MREAKAEDHRRHVYQREFGVSVSEFRFTGVPALGDGILHFEPGPSVLCGGNGVGKSSVLHAILITMDPVDHGLTCQSLKRLEGGRFVAVVETPEGLVERESRVVDGVVVSDSGPPICPVIFLDLGPQCHNWLQLFERTTNLEEMLEALEPSVSDENELKEINYLVRKDYTARLVYEIEEYDAPVPFFIVEHGELNYTSVEMGLGELALHAFYWQLTSAPADSILLLEEPETFISPRSQKALFDLVCLYALKRSFCTFITTHSLGVAGRAPREAVSLLVRGGPVGTTVVKPPRPHQLNSVLGVTQRCQALVLVEDEVALLVGSALLDRLDPDLRFLVEIQRAGGTDGVTRGLSSLPQNGLVRLIGLYDANFDDAPDDLPWPHLNLPGVGPPEEDLRAVVAGAAEDLADAVQLEEEDVSVALAAVEGLEDHEWLRQLRDNLGIDMPRLVDGLVGLWLRVGDNGDLAEEFRLRLREAVEE